MKYMRIYTLLLLMFVFCTSTIGQFKPGLYSDTTINGVRIENGLPKGGGHKGFGFALLWTRVTNQTATPLELTIKFQADSFAIPPAPDSYLKLFLVPDSVYYFDYNSKGLNSFLDTALDKPSTLQKTIYPKEEYLFYIGMASSAKAGGMVRSGLVLKDQRLFYKAGILPHFDSILFPCGHIVFKKEVYQLTSLCHNMYIAVF
jgi:hypothetical protein